MHLVHETFGLVQLGTWPFGGQPKLTEMVDQNYCNPGIKSKIGLIQTSSRTEGTYNSALLKLGDVKEVVSRLRRAQGKATFQRSHSTNSYQIFIRDIRECLLWANKFRRQRNRLPNQNDIYQWIIQGNRTLRTVRSTSADEYRRTMNLNTVDMARQYSGRLEFFHQNDKTDGEDWLYTRSNFSGTRWKNYQGRKKRYYLEIDPACAPDAWRLILTLAEQSRCELDVKLPASNGKSPKLLQRHLRRPELIVIYCEQPFHQKMDAILDRVWDRFTPAFGNSDRYGSRFSLQYRPGINIAGDPHLTSSNGEVITSYHGMMAAILADEISCFEDELHLAKRNDNWLTERYVDVIATAASLGMSIADPCFQDFLSPSHRSALTATINSVVQGDTKKIWAKRLITQAVSDLTHFINPDVIRIEISHNRGIY